MGVLQSALQREHTQQKALKSTKGKSIFIYSNHVMMVGDAFHPNLMAQPRKAYVVVHPDTTSIPFIKNLVVMLGALPLPARRVTVISSQQ